MTEQHYNPILYQSLSNGPNQVYSPAQSSPASLVGTPATSGYHLGHMAMYNGGVPRYPVQMNLAQKARAAAAVARSSGLSSAVTITDPNNPTKNTTINGEGADKTGGATGSNPQQWTTLDLGGMGLKNVSRELFRYAFLTALYINHNNLHHLSPEISRLSGLTILDASGNKLTSVPPELGMLSNLKELLLVDNGLVTLPAELGTLYQLEILALEGNPLNESLKNLLQQEGTNAVIIYLRENCPVPLPPPEREWITLEDDSGASSGQDTFTTFCYNILAENYATSQMYGYTPSWALTWEYRKELILQEILAYSADIVCLQEVELGQYEDYFKEQMKQQADYDGVFWPKSRAKTMPEKDRRVVDGCAIFYKASKFDLIDKQIVEFNHVALQRPDFRKTEDIFNRVMTKDQIAVITLLEHKDTKNRIVVVNTHIYWDPVFKDVKLVQVAMLMDEIDKLSTQWAHLPVSGSNVPSSTSGKLPTLICGDFNSQRDSGVYEYLVKGSVPQGHDDFGDHAYGTYTSEGLSHKMTLRSAYSDGVELPFTNFTPTYEAEIDYIFYSSNYLSVLGLLGGVEKEYMSRVVGFPNAHFPSDHVPILAEFKFRSQSTIPKGATPNFGSSGSNNHNSSGNRNSGGGNSSGSNNSNNNNSSNNSNSNNNNSK
ncbi:Glucose-repressible alcohol dehydrogenase transcriptional effector [Entomortierella chlamydospora]|uniref:CCR4-Not complex 3'-5'-exoribonuclease subunit Ccr4 n=1 Tax=Entomortierella chlamydospora TaxID=101097 RepID=A0A9P6N2M3_9FUNG|nr:Glucose-repressible alcohol dehydrogenase transcriptional effector [Entomortierella chlamydospora]